MYVCMYVRQAVNDGALQGHTNRIGGHEAVLAGPPRGVREPPAVVCQWLYVGQQTRNGTCDTHACMSVLFLFVWISV